MAAISASASAYCRELCQHRSSVDFDQVRLTSSISTKLATIPIAAFSTSTLLPPSVPSLTSSRSSTRARVASLAVRSTLSRVAPCAASVREPAVEVASEPRASEPDLAVDAALAGRLEVGVPASGAREWARKPALLRVDKAARAPLIALLAACARSAGGRGVGKGRSRDVAGAGRFAAAGRVAGGAAEADRLDERFSADDCRRGGWVAAPVLRAGSGRLAVAAFV